ncbi:hypothetical protein [Halovivax sp.]|uniref:hypothetical protein n=1 Tax=Halovivax sp. TaxID=1935978 RepID=UPI0025BE8FDB|nr:hypothetical protein [Halovivax sp.]
MHDSTTFGILIMFGIVFVPVYVMFAGWFLGKPKQLRPVAKGIGYLVVYTAAIVVALGILGTVLSLIVPY